MRALKDSWERPGIYVATFQKLSMLTQDRLDELTEAFDLVIVDEGHSEPAPVWSKISRKFGKHRVIVTATPYRNDLFQFDVHADWNYVYTFNKAARDRVLREPVFEQVPIDRVLQRVKDALEADPGVKCIIKCKTYPDVASFLVRASAAEFQVIAVHERFEGQGVPNGYARVPAEIRELEWQVAVHQHMLDEGVDIPEAKVLVLAYPVASGRELVQAVGRVVRLFNDAQPLVIDCSSHANATMWRNYLEFDRYISGDGAWRAFIRSLDVTFLLQTYLNAFPEIGYFGNAFKSRFDISTFDPTKNLKIPLASFCFMNVRPDFSLESMCDTLYWRLHKGGELVRHIPAQAGFDVIVSVRFDSSRYLQGLLFFQPTLEVMLLARVGELLALFDIVDAVLSRSFERFSIEI